MEEVNPDVSTPPKRQRHYISDVKEDGQVVGVRVRVPDGDKFKNKFFRCNSVSYDAAKEAANSHATRTIADQNEHGEGTQDEDDDIVDDDNAEQHV